MIKYKDQFEDLKSKEDTDQVIEDFLGPNWFKKAGKISRGLLG